MLGHLLNFLHQLALDALGVLLAVFCALSPAPEARPREPEPEHTRTELSTRGAARAYPADAHAGCLGKQVVWV